MKCTLRKVNEGVVATVDEPKYKEWAFYVNKNGNITKRLFYKSDNTNGFYTIIASTFEVGKVLVINDKDFGTDNCVLILNDEDFNKQYEYTETDNSIIIKL